MMAEAETGLAGLRWVASSILCDTLKQGYVCLERDVPQEIKDLERNLIPRLKLMIQATEKSTHESMVKKWLEKVKSSLYDVEDLLGEHEYERVKHQINGNRCCECLPVPAHSLVETFQNLFDNLTRKAPQNMKLLKQLKCLKNAAAEGTTLFKFLDKQVESDAIISGTSGSTSPDTITSIPDLDVFVREMEQEAVINHILGSTDSDPQSSTTRRFSVFGIVGDGGFGKTTLAHHIFEDERVQYYFNIKMWVKMSQKLNIVEHTKEMINSASREKMKHTGDLENLQKELEKMLNRRDKILLVLDNVWWNQSDKDQWKSMLDPFRSHANNVTILLTSRSKNLPHPLLPAQIISLGGLDKENLSTLFFYYALNGSEKINLNESEVLESIGDEIILKLDGSPMSAKFVCAQLGKNLNAIFWRGVADNENFSGNMESLLWSFQQLDEKSQRCFLYCGIFPKGYVSIASDLVQLWIAEGFVEDDDIGESMFHELLSKGFFQVSNGNATQKSYEMHDLVHDLAELLSKDCFRIEDEKAMVIPPTTRYLSVLVENIEEHILNISNLESLHTLIFLKESFGDLNEFLAQILVKLRKLRVLLLNGGITILPEHVGDLKHLQYLNLASTTITELPSSICNLYNLQIVKLNSYINSLPNYISYLVRLRYLEAYDSTNQIKTQPPSMPYIGRLTFLRELQEFSVRKVDGYNLGQLGNLNDLKGTLKLRNLENVESKEEAMAACLNNKKNIEGLHLIWSNDANENLDLEAEVIESLRLPPKLKRLTVKKYKNVKFPCWVLDQSVIENLEYLNLCKCDAIESIPSNIGLAASSFELHLEKLWNLRELPTLPINTTYVKIESCPLLVFIGTDELEAGVNQMSSELKKFVISRLLLIILTMQQGNIYMNKVLLREWRIIEEICKDEDFVEYLSKASLLDNSDDEPPDNNRHYALQEWWRGHLQRVTYIYSRSNPMHLLLPSNITKLELEACNITNDALYECMAKLIWLEHLKLVEIMTITTFPLEIAMQSLISLRELIIEKCWCLTSLGGIRVVTSLKTLSLNFCPCLRDGTVLPKSVEEITVKNSYLPNGFIWGPFPFLKSISLECCRGLASISISHATLLEKLVLHRCPDLSLLEGLLDQPMLKHVELMYLPKLVPGSLSNEGFGIVQLNHLEVLKVSGCNMSSLSQILKSLSSLKRLEIFECWGISALPELPDSLETIQIEQWPELTSQCQEPYGEDWPKIEHVPERLIWNWAF